MSVHLRVSTIQNCPFRATKMAASVLLHDADKTTPALCEKQEYIGAVTLVHFSDDGSLLYVGVGSTVYLYETRTGELVAQHDIMTRGILHGGDFGTLLCFAQDTTHAFV